MITEDKELLLKDLCARLPYKTKVSLVIPPSDEFTSELYYEDGKTLTGILYAVFPDKNIVILDELSEPISQYNIRCGRFNIEWYEFKPYLRPRSSMTMEEIRIYRSYCDCDDEIPGDTIWYETIESFDYLNSIHVDYRGLIEKGLAIEVTEENNPYK